MLITNILSPCSNSMYNMVKCDYPVVFGNGGKQKGGYLDFSYVIRINSSK